MKRLLKISFFALILNVNLACQSSQETGIKTVDKTDIESDVIGKAVQLVDVRTVEEYEAGHIGNAMNYNIIDSASFLKQIQNLDKTKPVYLYCKMGGRSNRAAELLKEEGFTKIFDYSGGYNDWISQ